MYKVILFAGTTEGRKLAEFLDNCRVPAYVCVATQYGGSLLGESTYRRVSARRLEKEQMEALFLETKSPGEELLVVDATHPYAAAVSENIKTACEKTGCEYLRLLRESAETQETENAEIVTVSSAEEAVDFLRSRQGNILVTTGSKELARFTKLKDYRERVFARVLSTRESVELCESLGFSGRHLICMQGPFTEEMNAATLRQFEISWMVTKESGKAGGFSEKIQAAQKAGAGIVLIGRPSQTPGKSLPEVCRILTERLELKPKRQIDIVGIGMGNGETMTLEAKKACEKAQLLVGARRMLEGVGLSGKAHLITYQSGEVLEYLKEHPEYQRIALLQSGDVGFYSGAKKLAEAFDGEEIHFYPGISSVVYFCARLGIPWQDVHLMSLHGKEENLPGALRYYSKVFALAGRGRELRRICEKLEAYGFGQAVMTVGERLSYPDERILKGTPESLKNEDFQDLCVFFVENPGEKPAVTHGMEDEEFLRGEVPMTKSEVRSVCLSKLRLKRDSLLWDVGAGTGSVSVEAALQSFEGMVYAVEKKPEAVELIRKNKIRFCAENLEITEGTAPKALEALPAPTHVFIGGSSGNLREIMEAALKKNPRVRIVLTCIALETVAETMQCLKSLPLTEVDMACVSVAKAREIGSYHMMMGQNPVYVISCTGADIEIEKRKKLSDGR